MSCCSLVEGIPLNTVGTNALTDVTTVVEVVVVGCVVVGHRHRRGVEAVVFEDSTASVTYSTWNKSWIKDIRSYRKKITRLLS